MCLVLGQATSFVALYLYSSNADASTSRDLWVLLVATEAGFATFFAIFIGAMTTKYKKTFFSTETANTFVAKRFRDALSDKAKVHVFACHPSYYASIRDEVEHWVRENFEDWLEDQPDWFTERVKASIPKD